MFMSQAHEINFITGILLQNFKLKYTLSSGHILGSYSPMLIYRSVDRVQISIALPVIMSCFDSLLPLVLSQWHLVYDMSKYAVYIYIYTKVRSLLIYGGSSTYIISRLCLILLLLYVV